MSDINIILADRPGLGRIRLCECNSVHVSLGPVTINLEPLAFVQAVMLLQEAMEQLTEISGLEQGGSGHSRLPQSSQLTH